MHYTVDVDQDVVCFLTEHQGSVRSLEEDEPVRVDTRLIDSTSEMSLRPDYTPSATTHDDHVRYQSSSRVCREIRLTFKKGGGSDGKLRPKHLFLEIGEGMLRIKTHKDGAVQYIVPVSLVERLLYSCHYARTAGHSGERRLLCTLRQRW